jgi:Bacterial conjugation TrbI-like protein
MKNLRLILFVLLLVVIGIVVTLTYSFRPGAKEKLTQELTNPTKGLVGPILESQHEIKLAPSVAARQKTTPVMVSQPGPTAPVKLTRIRVYTGNEPTPTPEPLGDYAPYGRLVKCELVNTVDSSALVTPVIGLVTEDVTWNGKVIIPRRSEVHGTAQLDQTRERIASEGPFTFVLNDPDDPGAGRELVLKGVVLDREEDPNFKTYGITDGSAGLRGVVIQTDKLAEVKMFVASFISGISQGLQSTTTNVFGYTQLNSNGSTANIPGYVINPVSQGAQNVLNLYAQQILQAIQRDGFFIRVEAGKQFYVYIRQVINLNDAVVGGDPVRKRMKKQYLEERMEDEQISESRRERDWEKDEKALRSYQQFDPQNQANVNGSDAQRNLQPLNQSQPLNQLQQLQQPEMPTSPLPAVSPISPVPISNPSPGK